MDYKKLAHTLFSEVTLTTEDLEKKYPPRALPETAFVTRVAPSPTGFMHLGGVYSALISERVAHQSGGVFFLRIEDTDKKREVEGAISAIVESLNSFDIKIDEGEVALGKEVGSYGPYRQSARADIYKVYVKKLLEEGKAYVAFDTGEELEQLTKTQEEQKIRPGYRGEWALWRNKSEDEVYKALADKKPFVIRFKSSGDFEKKIKVNDLVRGERELSQNDLDIVIYKTDGLPTYHFAHVVDDHLARTTHVVRADEWFASFPLHLELWNALGWTALKYAHFSPIQKMDDGSRRKLSKRKDPEANILFYKEKGYPARAVIEYLLNLANSSFEDWRKANPTLNNTEFVLKLEKMSPSGALYDENKLIDISKNVVAQMTADEVYGRLLVWAREFDNPFADILSRDVAYTKKVLNIERGGPQGRKDISKWSSAKEEIGYFFDDIFAGIAIDQNLFSPVPLDIAKKCVEMFKENYSVTDDKDAWFGKIKNIAITLGYASSAKEYKLEPTKYKGNVADIAKVFRVLLTGKTNTPDLHQIMQVLGKDMVWKRLDNI